MQKWTGWKEKWEKIAKAESRWLTISLWAKSQLSLRLTTDKPAYLGRLFYWFNIEALTNTWFAEQFDKARVALGSRYTPESNVELPIRNDFLVFARDTSLERTVQEWSLGLREKGVTAMRALQRANKGVTPPAELDALAAATEALNQVFDGDPIGADKPFPVMRWQDGIEVCRQAVRNALVWAFALPASKPEHGTTDEEWARRNLFEFGDLLYQVKVSLASGGWRLVNARAVLLEGPAGIGKSHLLADVVEHQVHASRPALLILGSALIESEPWRQIMFQLDLPHDLETKQFLAALDAAAQAADVRAIICVDAINERHGPDIWPERLAAFLKAAEAFPRVGIVLSCRSTYKKYIVPDSVSDQLAIVVHTGFAGRGGEAANDYLTKRGIVRPGAPNLVPEFQNPLFLKTCCDFLDKEGVKDLPRGLRGVSSIFGFYNGAIVHAVTRRMKLDPNLDLVATALRRLAGILIARGESYAPTGDVIRAFEAIIPSGGLLERSLLSQLESEGVIAIEIVPGDDDSANSMVRFTFERYSDHAIAAQLLREHLDSGGVHRSFADGTPLGDLLFGEHSYRFAGIIEAIAIQLPEKAGAEIADVRSEEHWAVQDAFLESLLWREQVYFTDRTLDLVKRFRDYEGLQDVLVSISTEPANKFNAEYLHRWLSSTPMPERDTLWSVYLNKRGNEDDPVGTLINWAIQNGMGSIDHRRARLSAVVLAWFLTSSNRSVRDKATKAIACIFANRLELAAVILRLLGDIDDLYVRERLFAAAYGAALQGRALDGLSEVAATTYELVFANGSPPLNELLRDHARGIIFYAQWRGALPSNVNANLVRPPYQSPWPIEYVPDEIIEGYTQQYSTGVRLGDDIVGSTARDGDFARYVIDRIAGKWAPIRRGDSKRVTAHDLAREWLDNFSKASTPVQEAAFRALVEAARALGGDRRYEKTPEREALDAAENSFRATLPGDLWEEYRVTARHFVRYSYFSDKASDDVARFNNGWARRWVCKRAHDLGWTPERFADIDQKSSYDRFDHHVERIGKKYQWLALYELTARLADNVNFLGDTYDDEQTRDYDGAFDIGLRNIDPSLLITNTYANGWKLWTRTWWVPIEPRLRPVAPIERLVWLESDRDVLNHESFIEVIDPRTKRRWLALNSTASADQYGMDGERKELQRKIWFRVSSIVVAKGDKAKVLKGLKSRTVTDRSEIPEFHLDLSYYLGEYPWHEGIKETDDWVAPDDWNQLVAPVRPTISEYVCESGGYDYSVDSSIRIELPAPWLANKMGLRLLDGKRPIYVDERGEVRFFDPSVIEPGHQAALVDRDAFLAMLDREDLAAIWVITGEKEVYGGQIPHTGFGGRLLHTGIYTLRPNGFARTINFAREKPSLDQLTALLGERPSAEIRARYSRN
ncbi:MAG: hypothetical protein ACJ746_22455 [Bryobacteraceae bacterium]